MSNTGEGGCVRKMNSRLAVQCSGLNEFRIAQICGLTESSQRTSGLAAGWEKDMCFWSCSMCSGDTSPRWRSRSGWRTLRASENFAERRSPKREEQRVWGSRNCARWLGEDEGEDAFGRRVSVRRPGSGRAHRPGRVALASSSAAASEARRRFRAGVCHAVSVLAKDDQPRSKAVSRPPSSIASNPFEGSLFRKTLRTASLLVCCNSAGS